MSLLRLLTAGKSLVGLKKSETRYNVTSCGLLPKFVSKRNPFGKSTGKRHPQIQGDVGKLERTLPCAASAPKGEEDLPAVVSVVQPEVRAEGQAQSDGPTEPSHEKGSLVRALAGWLEACASRMGKLLVWRRTASGKPPIPRFNKALVQGELTLERVKVVRNDLSDTDLEVVRSKPQTNGPERSPVIDKQPESMVAQAAATPLSKRLFSAGRT